MAKSSRCCTYSSRLLEGVSMSLFNIFEISGSAISAQSQRLNAVASNLANADSVAAPGTPVYRAKEVVFSASQPTGDGPATVQVSGVIEDNAPPKQVYDPKNPAANSD